MSRVKVTLFGRLVEVDAAYWTRHLQATIVAAEMFASFAPIATQEQHREAVKASDAAYRKAMGITNFVDPLDVQMAAQAAASVQNALGDVCS